MGNLFRRRSRVNQIIWNSIFDFDIKSHKGNRKTASFKPFFESFYVTVGELSKKLRLKAKFNVIAFRVLQNIENNSVNIAESNYEKIYLRLDDLVQISAINSFA